MSAGKMAFGIATTVASLLLMSCRRVDSSESSSMATKPSELFSTDAKRRCQERAAQLNLSAAQQASLCEVASSSAPVDCFRKKMSQVQGVSADTLISQCRSSR